MKNLTYDTRAEHNRNNIPSSPKIKQAKNKDITSLNSGKCGPSSDISFRVPHCPINFQSDRFNLSNTLVKSFNVDKPVRYYKDSTLKNLTGISAHVDRQPRPSIDCQPISITKGPLEALSSDNSPTDRDAEDGDVVIKHVQSERTQIAESDMLVDWQKSPIWENTSFTTIFNYEKQA